MKLYFKAGACSLAPHIVMAELNMIYELESVDLKTKKTTREDYHMINPKGSVPALRMENGEILTEGAVIMQYLADQKPEMGLIPKMGTTDRYRCLEWLNFIATELHRNFSPLFSASMIVHNTEGQNDLKNFYQETLKNKFSYVAECLKNQTYLMGNQFTVSDAYLYTVLGWCRYVGLDYTTYPALNDYMKRVGERPGVLRALKEEGLI